LYISHSIFVEARLRLGILGRNDQNPTILAKALARLRRNPQNP
jgi:hypothetical protein